MKVVHICNAPLPTEHPDYRRLVSHPGRWVLNLALAQKQHTEIQPELLVQVPGASRDFETNIEGVPTYFVKAPNRFRASTFFFFDTRRLALRARALAPNLVHAHGTEDAYGLAAQHCNLPHVITAQGLHFLIKHRVKPRLISRERVAESLEKYCLKRARHVVAKSGYVRDSLAKAFPNLCLHQIPNTIDPRLFEIDGGQKDPKVIAFVGTIIPRKGVDLICDALAIVQRTVPNVTLWVFGDYPDAASEYENAIKNRLRSVLGERVVFHGAVPSLELARHLAKAAALVAPSREEMFGNQLIEALIVGTYAIVTEGTAMAENIRRFGGGTVVPQENPEALAQAITIAVTNPPHVPTAAVRRQIREQMGPEVVARRHYNLYVELLDGS